MSEEKKISTSEIVGELRRSVRTYKIFEKALLIAETIANHEQEVKALKKKISSLSAEKEELNTACDEFVERSNEAEKKFKELDAVIKIRLEEAEKTGKDYIDSAIEEAREIVNKAKAESRKIKQGIKSLETTKQAAQQAKDLAEEEYKHVKNKVQQIKDSLIKELST